MVQGEQAGIRLWCCEDVVQGVFDLARYLHNEAAMDFATDKRGISIIVLVYQRI